MVETGVQALEADHVLELDHDKSAASAMISIGYGGAPRFLVPYGREPGGKNSIREVDRGRSKRGRRSDDQ